MTTEEQRRIKKNFGERLKAIRKAKGLSQPKLSHIIEMDAGWISRMELGKANPSMIIIIKLARALECQPGELLDGL